MDIAGIALRSATYIVLMLAFGMPAFAVCVLPDDGRDTGASRRALIIGAAIAGLLLSLAGIVALAAQMSGAALASVDLATVKTVVASTAAGTAWAVRMIALLGMLVVATMFPVGRAALLAVTGLGGAALATLAWSGHGTMDDGDVRYFHIAADIGHLLAAGVWFGALAVLATMLFRHSARFDAADLRRAHRSLVGFAGIGSLAVLTIIATGLVNAWLLVGPDHVWSLGATLYGQLLLAKLALFGAMLGLAALNRFRLTPALGQAVARGDTGAAVRALRFSLALETGSAASVLALVAWLGTLAPPASA